MKSAAGNPTVRGGGPLQPEAKPGDAQEFGLKRLVGNSSATFGCSAAERGRRLTWSE